MLNFICFSSFASEINGWLGMGAYVGNRCTYLIGSKRKVQKSTLNKQTNKQTNMTKKGKYTNI